MIWKPLSLQSQTDLSVLLGQNVMDHLTMYICQSESAALVTVSQLLMIDTKQSQNRRMKIMNMNMVLDTRRTIIRFMSNQASSNYEAPEAAD